MEKKLVSKEYIDKVRACLNGNLIAYEETLAAIACYKKAPVPKGLYFYRNELDILINKQTKDLKQWNNKEVTLKDVIEEK